MSKIYVKSGQRTFNNNIFLKQYCTSGLNGPFYSASMINKWRSEMTLSLKRMTVAVMLAAIVFTNAHATSVTTHMLTKQQVDHAFSIRLAYIGGNITASEYEKRAKVCSDENNIYCSSFLGRHYYGNKEYRKAYPLLMKSQGIIKMKDFVSEGAAPSEELLGNMFRFGDGVMQSDDTAIEHYKVCASLGNTRCAIGIFSSYMGKFEGMKVGSPSYESAVKSAYAWAKVTQGLGVENYRDTEGEIIKLSEGITTFRKGMIHASGERLAIEADGLASVICSTISGCIQ